MNRIQTSIRLSKNTKELLERLAEALELSQTDVIAMAIKELAAKKGIK